LLRSNASPGGDGPAMAYDAARGQSVLFVGGAWPPAQTWLWSGNGWTQATGVQPPPRQFAVMAYDPTSQSVLLVGGGNVAGPLTPDTWQWNGSTWQQLTRAARAPARYGATGAWDTGRGVLVVSGGFDTAGNHSDTWEWNGVQWRPATPEGTPPGYAQAVTYDPIRDRVVVFGGNSRDDDQTWEFDGNRWSLRSPATITVQPRMLSYAMA